MYGGITRGTFPVTALTREPALLRYTVALSDELAVGLVTGASVSIDGVCQTAMRIDGSHIGFEAIAETLGRTTLANLKIGAYVAVERSLRAGDEIGGHELAGHVIGTGEVQAVRRDGHAYALRIGVPSDWMKYIQHKGFVAVDGSSLTVGETTPESFDVHLIPETLRLTNLGKKQSGDRVNIELDARTVAIVDTVERVLATRYAQSKP